MKVVLKKTIADRFAELLYENVYEQGFSNEDVDYIIVTKTEAIEIFNYSTALNRRLISDEEKILTVSKSHFCGFNVKVEGLN